MHWIHSADPRWQRGAAAVEMAIILPLLMLFVGGIVDFGRFFLTEIQLTNAVREGARVAVMGESAPGVITRVERAAPVVAGLAVNPEKLCPGDDAKVTATGDFEWILLGPAMSFFGSSPTSLPNATATAVMRCEA